MQYAEAVYLAQNGVTAQNGEQPVRLQNGLLYPREEVEQRTHSGDEIARTKDLVYFQFISYFSLFDQRYFDHYSIVVTIYTASAQLKIYVTTQLTPLLMALIACHIM